MAGVCYFVKIELTIKTSSRIFIIPQKCEIIRAAQAYKVSVYPKLACLFELNAIEKTNEKTK